MAITQSQLLLLQKLNDAADKPVLIQYGTPEYNDMRALFQMRFATCPDKVSPYRLRITWEGRLALTTIDPDSVLP